MGEARFGSFRVRFDSKVKLEFHGARVSSDGGLLAYRELDEALGLTATADECLRDTRPGSNVQHRMVPLLRQSVYGRLAGYEDLNDAERLRVDPVKIGAKVVRHARYVVFQMAEVAIPRRLFATILRRIGRLCPVPV